MHFAFATLGYHPDSTGGAFRYVAELAAGLARRGHGVEAVFPSDRTDGTAEADGVRLHRLRPSAGKVKWFARNRATRERLGVLRREDPNLIIVSCHGYFARAVSAMRGNVVSLFTGPWAEEFVLTRRNGALANTIAPLLRGMERGGLEQSRVIFTISEYYRRMLPQWHAGVGTPIHVIGGGVDLRRFRPAENREELRKKFGVLQGDFVLLAVRRLEPRMGLRELIDAFATICAEFPRATLWIGGTGSQRNELEALAARLGLRERVKFLGFIPEAKLPERYAAADCTLMPSLDLEGFGLATVESLACGTPVVGSNCGATPEILEPFAPELLYEPGKIAAKLRDILSGTARLPAPTECREYAEQRYDWGRLVVTFEKGCGDLFGGAA